MGWVGLDFKKNCENRTESNHSNLIELGPEFDQNRPANIAKVTNH